MNDFLPAAPHTWKVRRKWNSSVYCDRIECCEDCFCQLAAAKQCVIRIIPWLMVCDCLLFAQCTSGRESFDNVKQNPALNINILSPCYLNVISNEYMLGQTWKPVIFHFVEFKCEVFPVTLFSVDRWKHTCLHYPLCILITTSFMQINYFRKSY